jgi:site-specific recombinase XerD
VISLAPLLETFFLERLQRQRQASPHTIAAYRDTFRLLLRFAETHLGKPPSELLLTDLDASLVAAFLDHLEQDRGNSVQSRNARLAAIRSFFRFAAGREPAHSGLIQRVLAMPQKRFDRKLVTFLSRAELDALLAAPDTATWLGRRDQVLLAVAVETGFRVSELIALRTEDFVFGVGAHVRCRGKGRKERCTPIRRHVAAPVKAWLTENHARPADVVFPRRGGAALSRDAVERLVAKYAAMAARRCPTLTRKHVTPHVLRHSTAVGLLEAGVDRSVIALWLGHVSVETTQMYLDADLAMKERALARTAPVRVGPTRFRPRDSLLAFLEGL